MPGNSGRAGAQLRDQVVAQLVFDGAVRTAPVATAWRSAPNDVRQRHKINTTARCRMLAVCCPSRPSPPSRTAADRSFGPRTRSPPSITRCALGVDGLECDVHLSRDGEPVVIHDPTLDRTTDATGPGERAHGDGSSRAVDAGARFGAGRRVSRTVARALACRGSPSAPRSHRQLPIVVEIKGDRPEVAERTLAVVREARRGRARHLRRIQPGRARGNAPASRPDMPTSASSDEARAAVTAATAGARADRFRLFQCRCGSRASRCSVPCS